MKFEELEFVDRPDAFNRQALVDFPNGYGASVVIGPYTYGGDRGLYELVVIKDGRVCYDTPITNDVVGFLKPESVTDLLTKIENLPTAEVSP